MTHQGGGNSTINKPDRIPSRGLDLAVAVAVIAASGLILFTAGARFTILPGTQLFAQSSTTDEGAADEDTLSPRQINQYVAVYRTMQHNHRLTVEQACARQGLTISAFRAMEQKIEHNDQLRNEVRRQLQSKQNS
ncbi:MAG: hypothetical protein IVW54_10480 [Candidatus Binataceae bacterium]|nr:hypothetical protein [Candidatus Binataceae bacterium]